MAKISVLGSGSWGLALALLLHNNGHEVLLWSARPENARKLREKRENPDRLPGVRLPDEIDVLTDLERALKDVDVTVLAVASPYIRSTAHKMASFVCRDQKIVNVAKGIEEKTLKTLSEVIEEEIPQGNVAVLSGPSHAEEVGRGLILGVELGGALKNVIALAAGTADGLGYGDNTKAALITRGITEIGRLGKKMGAQMETFYGLSGIGDLIVTCASKHSRNRKAGYLIGQGYTMEEAMKEVQMVVEGVYSARAARELAEKYEVEMPIITEVNRVLFEGKSAAEAVMDLMLRDKKVETPMLPWENA